MAWFGFKWRNLLFLKAICAAFYSQNLRLKNKKHNSKLHNFLMLTASFSVPILLPCFLININLL